MRNETFDVIQTGLVKLDRSITEYWWHFRYVILKSVNRFDFEFQTVVFDRSPDVVPIEKSIRDLAYSSVDCFNSTLRNVNFSRAFYRLAGNIAIEFETDVGRFVDIVNRLDRYSQSVSWRGAFEFTFETAQSLFEKIIGTIISVDHLVFRSKADLRNSVQEKQGNGAGTVDSSLSWDSEKKQGTCRGYVFSLANDPALATWFECLWEAKDFLTFPEATVMHEILKPENVSRLNRNLEKVVSRDIIESSRNRGKGQRINPKYRL